MPARHPYTVALRDLTDLPSHRRAIAEARYARALERQLGGPEGVAGSLAAVQQLQRRASSGEEAAAQIHRWARAVSIARRIALRGLGQVEGVFVLVRTP
ncbi:hypothetical protein [Paracidovorax cattleyae]|uniref:hypothetical protein n=1 Tax=Paracidovorax cattleyae TaxID=80868 RepID=UPI0018AF5988|nr:hypothetical protein [Paracidovorax cattleyae]MBF9265398.1 hypothetical protein [Paracidovorax cattleyae]UYL85503.1 hypothetical protein gp48c [Acidovorax phage Aval]